MGSTHRSMWNSICAEHTWPLPSFGDRRGDLDLKVLSGVDENPEPQNLG